jgi:hypothetical protein
MKISRHRALRTIGWVAAYVLALHTMLFGLAATPSLQAASTGSLVVELCLSGNGDNGDAAGHSTRDHCASCFTISGALPPPAAASPLPVSYAQTVARGLDALSLAPRPAFAGRPGLPRAPPLVLA